MHYVRFWSDPPFLLTCVRALWITPRGITKYSSGDFSDWNNLS